MAHMWVLSVFPSQLRRHKGMCMLQLKCLSEQCLKPPSHHAFLVSNLKRLRHILYLSEPDNLTGTPTPASVWSGVWRWESIRDLKFSLKLFFSFSVFTQLATADPNTSKLWSFYLCRGNRRSNQYFNTLICYIYYIIIYASPPKKTPNPMK